MSRGRRVKPLASAPLPDETPLMRSFQICIFGRPIQVSLSRQVILRNGTERRDLVGTYDTPQKAIAAAAQLVGG